MSAPDLQTLYAVETQVEGAWKQVLAGLGIDAFTQRETENLPIPRVDVQCSLGDFTGHRGEMMPGVFTLDAWNATIGFEVVTKRVQNQPALHAETLAKVRMAAAYYANNFTQEVLPYHSLVYIQEQSTSPQIEADDDTDRSILNFSAIVCIRTNAWPQLT
jgi:hypothetical protein